MWSQLKGALRNVILFPTVILTVLIIYSIFIMRGRTWIFPEDTDDPLLCIVNRLNPPEKLAFDFLKLSDHLTFQLTKLPDERYERKITNQSWRPFLVMMYEFENWRYTLPDEMLLRYASRYVIRNTRTELDIDSGIGFGCGSGLGMTLIRPWESFVDTITFKELMPRVFLRDQLAFLESGRAFDHLTGTFIGNPLGERDQYDEASLLAMVPDDELEIRLYLPVTDYFSGEPARVYANGFTVGRWEMLEREVE